MAPGRLDRGEVERGDLGFELFQARFLLRDFGPLRFLTLSRLDRDAAEGRGLLPESFRV